MTIQYQKLGLADISLIQALGRATYEPYYQHIWHPGGLDWYMEKCFGSTVLEEELSDPNIEYLIPRDQHGAIIGLLKLLLLKPTPDGSVSNALYLEKIYLMPAFFKQGLGQKLMDDVCEKAKLMKREAIWLAVMKLGPVKAYERAGFQHVGEVYWEFEHLKEHERIGLVMLRQLP